MNSLNKARRQSSGIRSRRGCITCRAKKVKCDEQGPACSRCVRLKLQCEWSNVDNLCRRSNRSRSRANERPPKEILPKLQQLWEVNFDGLDEDIDIIYKGQETATRAVVPDWSETASMPFDMGALCDVGSSIDATADLNLSLLLGGSSSYDFTHYNSYAPAAESTVSCLSELTSPMEVPRLWVTIQEIALSPTFKASHIEQRALNHYQVKFSASRLTKNPLWNTHSVMLCQASQTPMVMHLLICVSLNDLGMRSNYDPNICRAAQQHFRMGTSLLMDRLNNQTHPDYISDLTSFYFLYLFISRQKDRDLAALDQLSINVANYVEQHRLDILCADPSSPHGQQLQSCGNSMSSKSPIEYLARTIIFLYYEDVMAILQGFGGSFARYLRDTTARTKDIYQVSSTILESYWGPEYPETEVIDDVENMIIMELIHDLMDIYQYVTEYWQTICEDRDGVDRTDTLLAAFEKKGRSIFRLVASTLTPRSHLLVNADITIAHFYALRIYHFRCSLTGLEGITPPQVQQALSSLLEIAQRTFSSGQSEYFELYGWKLFFAGIETQDAIHREWILCRLPNLSLKRTVEDIVQWQQRNRRRMTMSLIRTLLCGGKIPLT